MIIYYGETKREFPSQASRKSAEFQDITWAKWCQKSFQHDFDALNQTYCGWKKYDIIIYDICFNDL